MWFELNFVAEKLQHWRPSRPQRRRETLWMRSWKYTSEDKAEQERESPARHDRAMIWWNGPPASFVGSFNDQKEVTATPPSALRANQRRAQPARAKFSENSPQYGHPQPAGTTQQSLDHPRAG